jgi:hypothetical protein
MSRYIGILYNDNGRKDYAPISAKSLKEAQRVAALVAENIGHGSGGSQFVVDVIEVKTFLEIAENVVQENRPFTIKDIND